MELVGARTSSIAGESGAFGEVEFSTESWRFGDKSGCADAVDAAVMPYVI